MCVEDWLRQQDKGNRIRQGSPEEERALGQHLSALAPSTKQLTEAGQLAELLILLGMHALRSSHSVRIWLAMADLPSLCA